MEFDDLNDKDQGEYWSFTAKYISSEIAIVLQYFFNENKEQARFGEIIKFINSEAQESISEDEFKGLFDFLMGDNMFEATFFNYDNRKYDNEFNDITPLDERLISISPALKSWRLYDTLKTLMIDYYKKNKVVLVTY